jgi:hypothetical protein
MDVVADRLDAEVELGGDLLRRAAPLPKTKNLGPAGGEMRQTVTASRTRPAAVTFPFSS